MSATALSLESLIDQRLPVAQSALIATGDPDLARYAREMWIDPGFDLRGAVIHALGPTRGKYTYAVISQEHGWTTTDPALYLAALDALGQLFVVC